MFSADIADQICKRIAAGESLRSICKTKGFPKPSTVCDWVIYNHEGFSEQYTHARQVQAELIADELFTITDDESRDVSGELEIPNSVATQRDRLRVDTRKWYLSKVLPKIYGDKVEHTGPGGGPIIFTTREIGTANSDKLLE